MPTLKPLNHILQSISAQANSPSNNENDMARTRPIPVNTRPSNGTANHDPLATRPRPDSSQHIASTTYTRSHKDNEQSSPHRGKRDRFSVDTLKIPRKRHASWSLNHLPDHSITPVAMNNRKVVRFNTENIVTYTTATGRAVDGGRGVNPTTKPANGSVSLSDAAANSAITDSWGNVGRESHGNAGSIRDSCSIYPKGNDNVANATTGDVNNGGWGGGRNATNARTLESRYHDGGRDKNQSSIYPKAATEDVEYRDWGRGRNNTDARSSEYDYNEGRTGRNTPLKYPKDIDNVAHVTTRDFEDRGWGIGRNVTDARFPESANHDGDRIRSSSSNHPKRNDNVTNAAKGDVKDKGWGGGRKITNARSPDSANKYGGKGRNSSFNYPKGNENVANAATIDVDNEGWGKGRNKTDAQSSEFDYSDAGRGRNPSSKRPKENDNVANASTAYGNNRVWGGERNVTNAWSPESLNHDGDKRRTSSSNLFNGNDDDNSAIARDVENEDWVKGRNTIDARSSDFDYSDGGRGRNPHSKYTKESDSFVNATAGDVNNRGLGGGRSITNARSPEPLNHDGDERRTSSSNHFKGNDNVTNASAKDVWGKVRNTVDARSSEFDYNDGGRGRNSSSKYPKESDSFVNATTGDVENDGWGRGRNWTNARSPESAKTDNVRGKNLSSNYPKGNESVANCTIGVGFNRVLGKGRNKTDARPLQSTSGKDGTKGNDTSAEVSDKSMVANDSALSIFGGSGRKDLFHGASDTIINTYSSSTSSDDRFGREDSIIAVTKNKSVNAGTRILWTPPNRDRLGVEFLSTRPRPEERNSSQSQTSTADTRQHENDGQSSADRGNLDQIKTGNSKIPRNWDGSGSRTNTAASIDGSRDSKISAPPSTDSDSNQYFKNQPKPGILQGGRSIGRTRDEPTADVSRKPSSNSRPVRRGTQKVSERNDWERKPSANVTLHEDGLRRQTEPNEDLSIGEPGCSRSFQSHDNQDFDPHMDEYWSDGESNKRMRGDHEKKESLSAQIQRSAPKSHQKHGNTSFTVESQRIFERSTLSRMKAAELKGLCKKLGLPVAGKKETKEAMMKRLLKSQEKPHEYSEKDLMSKYTPVIVDHSFVIEKFLVEWTKNDVPAIEDQSTRADCRSWISFDDFLFPALARTYLSKIFGDQDELIAKFFQKEEFFRAKNTLSLDDEHESLLEFDFCCFICKCPDSHNLWRNVRNCPTGLKYHRACCHGYNTEKSLEHFVSKAGKAFDTFLDEEDGPNVLLDKESEYSHNIKPCGLRIHSAETMMRDLNNIERPAVVLSINAGMGVALALKQTNIEIKRIIYAEEDCVMQHVIRFHHDLSYGGADLVDDEIDHVVGLYNTLDELSRDPLDLVEKFEAVDLIICSIKGDTKQEQEQYTSDFFAFLKNLKRVNRRCHQSDSLFFLLESPEIDHSDTKDYSRCIMFDSRQYLCNWSLESVKSSLRILSKDTMSSDFTELDDALGFPKDYSVTPVKALFTVLKSALMIGCEQKKWSDEINPKYWSFMAIGPSGYSFKVTSDASDAFDAISLLLKEPVNSEFLDSGNYVNHLLSRSLPVPWLVCLLGPLESVFQTKQSYLDPISVLPIDAELAQRDAIITDYERRLECQICLSIQEDRYAFVPCGHSICGECYRAGVEDHCITCQCRIESSLKVHF